MKKTVSIDNERIYKNFDKKCHFVIRCLSIALLVLLSCFFIALKLVTKDFLYLIIAILLIVLYIIIARLICKNLYKKRRMLYINAYGEQQKYERTGIFKELWDEFEDNKFENLVEKGKIVFEEAYNNCIEIVIKKNNHEFIITIYEDEIACIMDEETDSPIEKRVPLANVADINDFYKIVSSFISQNS